MTQRTRRQRRLFSRKADRGSGCLTTGIAFGGQLFSAPGCVRPNFYGFEMARLAIMPHFDSVEIEHDRAPRGSSSALPCVPSCAIAEFVINCGVRDKWCPFSCADFSTVVLQPGARRCADQQSIGPERVDAGQACDPNGPAVGARLRNDRVEFPANPCGDGVGSSAWHRRQNPSNQRDARI